MTQSIINRPFHRYTFSTTPPLVRKLQSGSYNGLILWYISNSWQTGIHTHPILQLRSIGK
jgi:hypothetical protein